MMHTTTAHTTTAQRLEQLAQLYRQDQASDLMERTLEKLFRYEADLCRSQLRQLTEDLVAYEQQYDHQSSREFFSQYQQGQTDDRIDYVEWASLFQMTQRLEHRLTMLESGGNT